MNSKLRIYIGFLILLFVAIIVMDLNEPKPIDWRPTYSTNDKIPFGLYILDQELPTINPNNITKFSETPYEYLEAAFDYDTVANYTIDGTLLVISQENTIDEQSAKYLLNYASHENVAFISMKTFPKTFADSLKFKIRTGFTAIDSMALWMANPDLGTQKHYLSEDIGYNYFSEIDTVNTTILGYQSGDSARVNFIKVRYDDSDFYLHTQPAAFTNLHLLKADDHKYAEKVLSYLPDADIHWYNKSVNQISSSQLRYIFTQPALTWAWYLFLSGLLIFILFNSKRKQRVVPIIKPLQNTTVEFAKTIGNLYYQEGDYDTIIDKKIVYFLEHIRTDYLMDTTVLNDDFIRKLQQKSEKDPDDIERAVFLINMHRKSPHSSIEADLIQINNAIEKIVH